MARRTGYLGLGSNVGDRLTQLQAAVDTLPQHGVTVLAASSVYETKPVGEVTDQRNFYNACVRIETALSPDALLAACKATEQVLGRESGGVRHGPRRIDIDLLMLGDLTYVSERLALPHPEIRTRRFVLVPLLELDPELALPDGTPLSELLSALGRDQGVRLTQGILRTVA